MSKIDYNNSKTSGLWLSELFPDGDWPNEMSVDYFNSLKERHKELIRKREIEEERFNELKKKEFEAAQERKDQIEYTEELATEICERISAGELLINVCMDYHMPTIKRCNIWLKANQDFSTLYNQALQDRLSIFEEEVIAIADDITSDYKEITIKNVKRRVPDPEVIARAKLRIEVRFRHLKAGKPNKWGDTSTLITKSEDVDDPSNLSNEELEKRIADIEAKDRALRNVK